MGTSLGCVAALRLSGGAARSSEPDPLSKLTLFLWVLKVAFISVGRNKWEERVSQAPASVSALVPGLLRAPGRAVRAHVLPWGAPSVG